MTNLIKTQMAMKEQKENANLAFFGLFLSGMSGIMWYIDFVPGYSGLLMGLMFLLTLATIAFAWGAMINHNCPTCEKIVHVDAEECAHCGFSFADIIFV